MAKVISFRYKTDSGNIVEYCPDDPEIIDDDTLSIMIRLIDGTDIQDIVDELI